MNRNRAGLINLVLVALALGFGGPAAANPDVWVRAALTFHLAATGVAGLTYRWRFDDYFSSRNIETYDADGNGVFEAGERERLRSEVFEPLRRHGYYVHLWHGDRRVGDLAVGDFDARIEGSSLVVEFHLALEPPLDPAAAAVVASLFDGEIVVDFKFEEQAYLLVEGVLPADCKFRLARGKGPRAGHPQPVTFKCGA